ncbi:MAG: methyltransferase domain-containing protein [Alphaproteobacteria bacterium]|nr:methyltransferase domain-containing protein [Alphaproteobacteria bacterium]
MTAGGEGLDEFRDRYEETMERMFAAVGALYAEHWGEFFHFALFDDSEDGGSDAAWEAAFARTHARYAEALRVADASNVLEVACGRGAFAEYLAARTTGRVLGIDIARAQLAAAERRRRPNLGFLRHDAMHVAALGARFDAVACLDAECYFPDKAAAVAGIAEAMRPGARFLLVAWCRRERLGKAQARMVLCPLMHAWGIAGLETASAYRRHFRRAGLRLVEEADLNAQAQPNWERGYRRALEALRGFSPVSAARLLWNGLPVGADGIRLIEDQFAAALYIKAAFDAGFLRYTYFLAERG